MSIQDTSQIKDKIISILRTNGPSLPVHIANRIENSILFTSAFLSELLSERRIKMSYMHVGNSPIYYLEGQESRLENFAQYLRNKEKEAFLLLKEKKFLKDSVQQPAIRVALREIKDFAIPFKHEEEIFWRYFTIPMLEFQIPSKKKQEAEKKEKELGIFDKHESKDKESPKPKKKAKPKKKKTGSNEKMFNEIKEFMTKNSIDLKDISSFSKNEIVLIVEEKGIQKVLVAFSKNKVGEKEISEASKKSKEVGLPYILLSRSGVLKKIESLIEDLKNLDEVKSLND